MFGHKIHKFTTHSNTKLCNKLIQIAFAKEVLTQFEMSNLECKREKKIHQMLTNLRKNQ
jgi:hypothetical protein